MHASRATRTCRCSRAWATRLADRGRTRLEHDVLRTRAEAVESAVVQRFVRRLEPQQGSRQQRNRSKAFVRAPLVTRDVPTPAEGYRRALDGSASPCHPPRHITKSGLRTGRVPVDRRQRDPVVGANRGDGGGEWTREPPDRTTVTPGMPGSNDQVGSGAERQRYRAAPIARDRPHGGHRTRAAGHVSAASPNEGGTAEGTTFRPGTIGRS